MLSILITTSVLRQEIHDSLQAINYNIIEIQMYLTSNFYFNRIP